MSKLMHTILDSRAVIWLVNTNTKQRITLVIGGVVILVVISFGIYQMMQPNDVVAGETTTKTEVTVEENGVQSTISTTTSNTDVNAVKSEYVPSTDANAQNIQSIESNATTVNVPQDAGEQTYHSSDGATFEGGDSGWVEETTNGGSNVSEQGGDTGGGSTGGWDGNMNIPDGDPTGSTGKPIFGNE